MKILITGASGYLGARITYFFAKQNNEVIAHCSKYIPQKKDWTEHVSKFIIGDIREKKTIDEIVNSDPEVIIHLVSLDHYDSEKEARIVSSINFQPVWNILEGCSEKSLKSFIYFSTIHVYGKTNEIEIDESHPTKPSNIYGLTH